MGASGAPGIPCALLFMRDVVLALTRARSCRGNVASRAQTVQTQPLNRDPSVRPDLRGLDLHIHRRQKVSVKLVIAEPFRLADCLAQKEAAL